MLYFHTFKSSPEQLRIDIVEDIRKINTMAVRAKRTGMIILGGGLVKHHIANANLMRNGAESAVYINTAQEFDGSDAGARPDEAVSWGKIKADAESVKVCRSSNLGLRYLINLVRSMLRQPLRFRLLSRPLLRTLGREKHRKIQYLIDREVLVVPPISRCEYHSFVANTARTD